MKSILVTGGAGYIGSTLIQELLSQRHKVACLDNFTYNNQSAIAQYHHHEKFSVINADVRFVDWKNLVNDFDIIIPLAALVGAPLCEQRPSDAVRINSLSIFEMLRYLNNQLVIYPNTNSSYGTGGEEPVTEESPLSPLSGYAKSKDSIENFVKEYSNHIVFRLATAFGVSPRHRMDLMVNEFVWRAVTAKSIILFEPHFRRNFVHVRDIARAFTQAITHQDTMRNNVYNVGDSRANMTKRELCERIKQHVPDFEIFETTSKADPDKRDYLVSNAKMEATGWFPHYTISDGVKELIKFYSSLKQFNMGNV